MENGDIWLVMKNGKDIRLAWHIFGATCRRASDALCNTRLVGTSVSIIVSFSHK